MRSTTKLTVSIVQADLLWEDKQGNLDRFESILSSFQSSQLIILPEMFTTGFTNASARLAEPMDGPTMAWFSKMAKEKNACIIGSFIAEESKQYFNRIVCMLPDGNYSTYDKKHLFSYAKENEYYTAGNAHLIFEYLGWKISPMICYDLRFPIWSRRITDTFDYDVLIYIASWPTKRIDAWSSLLKARAIENMSYTIGVNRVGRDGNGFEYSGASACHGPLGDMIANCRDNTSDLVTFTIEKSPLNEIRNKLNFQKDADKFELI